MQVYKLGKIIIVHRVKTVNNTITSILRHDYESTVKTSCTTPVQNTQHQFLPWAVQEVIKFKWVKHATAKFYVHVVTRHDWI